MEHEILVGVAEGVFCCIFGLWVFLITVKVIGIFNSPKGK